MFHTRSFACFTCFKGIWIDLISIFLSYFKSAVGRAAVCDDDLDISPVVLVFDGIKAGCQGFSGVVCGDYDGDGGVAVI
ncbi:MAG: hypothetical protein Q7J35_03860 [Candidatus Methanoperedens sp.]|nr:hypothetical protein [Candidatus Methanoperedens sp.]